METVKTFQQRIDDMHNVSTPRSLKRSRTKYSTPSPTERYGHETALLGPFEKRMKSAMWEPRRSVSLLYPRSVQALQVFEQGQGNSVGYYSPSTRPSALPAQVPPLVLRKTGRVYSDSLHVPRDSGALQDRYALQHDIGRENEVLRWKVRAYAEFNRDAMEALERTGAKALKDKLEYEAFKRQVSASNQLREAGLPQGWQSVSRQPDGVSSSPDENFRVALERSSSRDVVVSVGGMPRNGSRLDEEKVPSSSAGGENKQEPMWKELWSKAHEPAKIDKQASLGKEIEYTTTRLLALQCHRPSKIKAEDKTLVGAFTDLSAEAELAVDKALEGGNRITGHQILVTHEKSNIDVTRAVIGCLSPGVWLNDEVINVYMELLKEREVREPDRFLNCHFFNTFFYNKLFKDKRSYDYKAIRRWTTQKKLGYSLSDCDKILVPIHQDIHWCLAVINIREKRLEYLDSLKGVDRSVLDVLARYITDEAKDKDGKVLDASTWDQGFPQNIPEQLNGCDCGMFMVKYADFHSRGAPLQFSQDHMEYFRRKMVWEILDLKAT